MDHLSLFPKAKTNFLQNTDCRETFSSPEMRQSKAIRKYDEEDVPDFCVQAEIKAREISRSA
jgi:hypothetical protein